MLVFLWIIYRPDAWIQPQPAENQLHHQFSERCYLCHQDTDNTVQSLWRRAIQPQSAITSGQQCLQCHRIGGQAFKAHHLTTDNQDLKHQSLQKQLKQTIVCSKCHREHSNQDNKFNDVSCIYCHQSDNSSFVKNHVEFDQYPDDKQLHIHFNHQLHFNVNFQQSEFNSFAKNNCADCHQDLNGQIKLRNADDTCMHCHELKIKSSQSIKAFFDSRLPQSMKKITELKLIAVNKRAEQTPAGHQDRLVKQFYEQLIDKVLNHEDFQNDVKQQVLQLTSRDGPGLCLRCHVIEQTKYLSAEQNQQQRYQINWQKRQKQSLNRLTFFNHTPHILISRKENCQSCHYSDNSESGSGGFKKINKLLCLGCHEAGKTAQSCLDCHRYHIPSAGASEL